MINSILLQLYLKNNNIIKLFFSNTDLINKIYYKRKRNIKTEKAAHPFFPLKKGKKRITEDEDEIKK